MAISELLKHLCTGLAALERLDVLYRVHQRGASPLLQHILNHIDNPVDPAIRIPSGSLPE
jgi:hypothetical protein